MRIRKYAIDFLCVATVVIGFSCSKSKLGNVEHKEKVTVHVSGKSAAKSPVKPSAPAGHG